MPSLQTIRVYGSGGPNPPKINMILEELGLDYEVVPIPFSDVKKSSYTSVNPNGRLPSLHDPNTNLTIWESGAIIEYLVDTYDKKNLISFAPGTTEYWHARQWLFFQTTGQAPYFGQAVWFSKFHHEKIPSAVERYTKEIHRVSQVLEGWLTKQKEEFSGTEEPWLVGNKLSFADIAFVSWFRVIGFILSADQFALKQYPLLDGWLARMLARETIAKAYERSPQVA